MKDTEKPLPPLDSGRGWIVVSGSFLVNFIAFGVFYSFSTFFNALQVEFNATRGSTSWITSIANAVQLLFSSVVGVFIFQMGFRGVVLLGTFMISVGMLLFSFSTDLWHSYLSYGVVFGFGLSMCFSPVLGTTSEWFEKKRGLANGLTVAGSGLGNIVMALVITSMQESLGWRVTARYVSLMLFVLLLISCCLMKNRIPPKIPPPLIAKLKNVFSGSHKQISFQKDEIWAPNISSQSMPTQQHLESENEKFMKLFIEILPSDFEPFIRVVLQPTTEQEISPELKIEIEGPILNSVPITSAQSPTSADPAPLTPTAPILETPATHQQHHSQKFLLFHFFKEKNFVLLYLSGVFVAFGLLVPFVHMVPFCIDIGMSAAEGASVLAAMGAASTVGRVVMGWAADICGRLWLFKGSLFVMGLSTFFWSFAYNMQGTMAYAIIYAIVCGSYVSMVPPLIVDFFGYHRLSERLGLSFSGNAVGGLIGPPIVGFLIDATKSYRAGSMLAGVLMLVASFFALALPSPTKQRQAKI